MVTMTLLDTESAKRARAVGLPVLLDSHTENGKPVLRRAGERGIEAKANALTYLAGVNGTSGVVVQFYAAPAGIAGKPLNVEPELTSYDAAQLPTLRKYR